MRIAEIAEGVLFLQGWRRGGLAFLAGLIAALALQPLDVLPAFVIAFPLLVWLLDGIDPARGRLSTAFQAAKTGWFFGFGYLLAGLWWLGVAFIKGGPEFIFLLPFGVIILPMALALFFALGTGVAALAWTGNASRIIALALGLGFSEWLRSWVFTGFPWNGFGQAFANHLVLAQAASLIGTEGLGLVAVLVGGAFATLGTGQDFGQRWRAPLLAMLLVAVLTGFGLARLSASGGLAFDERRMPATADVRLRIMQPNVAQHDKEIGKRGAELLDNYLKLSGLAPSAPGTGPGEVTHIIWPEAPLPFILDREPRALDALTRFLTPRATLITGAIRAEDIADAEPGERRRRFYNSIQVLTADGLQGTYDKVHLVPFGEYLPFETILRALGIRQFVAAVGGFTAGAARRPLEVSGLPGVIPMVCFESIFPHELDASAPGPGVFIMVTNDGWFGNTSGPYQHVAQGRLRSIEFGQPVIRSANSGVSAVFDPYGRIVGLIPLNVVDILDSVLPAGLHSTLYRRTIQFNYGSVMIFLFLLLLLGRRAEGRMTSGAGR
jgi:apolipoprotein N-acyltransferase